MTAAYVWLQLTHPAGYRIEQDVVLAIITVLVGAISVRTLRALSLGQLLPHFPNTAAPST